jgi:glycosyltransferase involved in cell wall biosynthesis
VKKVFTQYGYPEDRVLLAPDGLDLQQLSEVRADPEWRRRYPTAHLVCGIGQLSAKKNWGLLVDVAALLRKGGHEVTWLLAGDGPEREALKQQAHDQGVADCIHLLGFREDALRLLKSCDLLFFPSRMEGASVTIREAMLLGTPVVTANAAGSIESLDGHGWTIDPDDAPAAAGSVLEALSDRQKLERIAEAAKRSAEERFSLDRTVEATCAAYERVMDRSPSY